MSTAEVDRKTRLIDELDLEPIAFKLVHPEPDETSMSVEEADDLINKYRRFLKLCAMYPERSIVPSKEIDQVWHPHILDTAKVRGRLRCCLQLPTPPLPVLRAEGGG